MYPGEATTAQRLLGSLEAAQRLGIWEWTPTTGEMVWSNGLYDLLAVSPTIAPTLDGLLAALDPEDRPRFESQLARARREHGVLAFRCRSGDRKTLQIHLQRALADDGSLRSIIGTSQDITDEAASADLVPALVLLAGALSHEINNPLAVISAVLQMLPASHPTLDALDAAGRIGRLVADLNLAAFGDRKGREPVYLDDALATALPRLPGLTRATVVTHLEPTPPVLSNLEAICRVLVELLANALEAIETSAEQRIEISTRRDDAWAVIEIADSGIGISSQHALCALDPFFTTKGVGRRGLGLAICRGIVEAIGGSISLYGQRVGVRVVVALPTTSNPGRAAPGPTPATTPGAIRGRVLIVEDEVLFANALSRMLRSEHEVTVVHNGKLALDKFEEGARYDAILCDVTMPEMTGPELHALLVERYPEQAQRMIFITGGNPPHSDVETFEKPCDVAKLREALQRRVAASRSGG